MASPRERILEITFDLFGRQGYNSTGINQIISEAKVAKASFYQYFKSKEDLCVEFLNVRHQYWFGGLENFCAGEDNTKLHILKSFDFLMHMNQKEDFQGCSFLNILAEIPRDNVKILSVIRQHKTDLRTYFSEQLKNEELSDHIYLLFESCIMESRLFKSNELIERSKKIITTLIP